MKKINEKNYSTIYLVRHGETEWNVLKKMQGHTDVELNEKGLSQAKYLADKFKTVPFGAAFSSDLIRAKKTAEIIALEHKIEVITKKVLRERFFGRLEGRSWMEKDSELQKLWDKVATLTDKEREKHRLWRVENDADVMTRFIPFLREIAVAFAGKNVLVVTHGGVMRLFLQHAGFFPVRKTPIMKDGEKTYVHISISNTAYAKIESDGVDFFVKKTEGIIFKS